MNRLLIANRGEIAKRIARTARDLSIQSIGLYSLEDAALAEDYGCSSLRALPGQGAAAYLDIEAILAIARECGADALAPGYGFLSERPALARACADAGIRFVGPAARVLEVLGDKSKARAEAKRLGLPILPGCAAPASREEIRDFFDSLQGREPIGSSGQETRSIVLKAAAGGGGRGMRRVRSAAEIDEAFARCASEAQRSFGSDALLAERWLERARHIEVQVVADASGGVSHLGDRDCSLQRRHQKLIEIAPAPNLSDSLRTALADAACTLARAVGYQGIGTFEFLLTPDSEFFFLEANPRIQVEHPVSEETTGVDLVETSLRIAEGESLAALGLASPVVPRGHAIEFRLLAESLDENGAPRPSPHEIERFELPSGPGVRVDTALRVGLMPHPAFDPLLAKIIVSSPKDDFASVVARADRLLGEIRVAGPETNLELLRTVLGRPEFQTGAFETRFFESHATELVASAEGIRRRRTQANGPTSPSASPPRAPESPPSSEGQSVVVSPLIGTIIETNVLVGDRVEREAALCVVESMKMEHLIRAPHGGFVRRAAARASDVVAEGQPLYWIEADVGEAAGQVGVASASVDLDSIRSDLAETRARLALLEDESRPEAVERRRARGQRTARANLADLCDPESFVEYGGLAVAAQRSSRPIEELERRTPADAILTGTATINADRFGASAARCAVLVADATVLAGTQGFYHHRKIDRILDIAERAKCPVIFLPEGGGGRPNDTDVGNLMTAGLNVTSFLAFARLAGKVPRVSVVSGFCFAGSAAFAGCADVIIATQDANLGMGGPAMIEGGGLGVFEPQAIGPVSVQTANGVVDLVARDEAHAIALAKQYLGYFQGRERDWQTPDQRLLRHAIPENRRRVYAVRDVIRTLCDEGSVLELREAFAPGMITALVRIEGHAFGLIANDPMHLGGAIDEVGAEKAARFLQLCDAFGLPIVSLCDTPGFMVGPEIERRAQVRKVSRLFVVGASLEVPLFTIILRKGYGLGAQAMAGGSFVAPQLIVAWPTGEIGGMGLEGAVDLGFKKALDEQPDAEARAALRTKLIDALYAKGKALSAASQLEFDGVIDPADTRATLLRALTAVGPIGPGSRRMIDTW